MKLALLITALAANAAPRGEAFEVSPRPIAWEDVSPTSFDLAWQLPAERRAPGRDLVREMRRLASLPFDVTAPDGTHLRTFGDLVERARALDPDTRRDWLARVEARAPQLFADWGAGIAQLLFDEGLRKDWDPERDRGDDGILTTDESWDLSAEGLEPWTKLPVRPRAEQAAVLMHAGLDAIKAAESDYRLYPEDVAADYEAIYPCEGSYLRGTDPAGEPFATLRVYVCSDLPFPYSNYECEIRQLHRVDTAGRPVTDIYAVADDFHWLAGRDVYLPVETGDGRSVAWLVVRLYGFDIDGVPDKPRHRRVALRSSLGNMKVRAETLQRGFGAPAEAGGGPSIPLFQVFGAR